MAGTTKNPVDPSQFGLRFFAEPVLSLSKGSE